MLNIISNTRLSIWSVPWVDHIRAQKRGEIRHVKKSTYSNIMATKFQIEKTIINTNGTKPDGNGRVEFLIMNFFVLSMI